MDTNSKAVVGAKRRGPYRHHDPALKRSIVEETLQPGASVARIARKHGINANQVFLWRKAYREGRLPEPKPRLLPVTLAPLAATDPLPEQISGSPANTDCLTIEFGQIRVRIEGRPDPEVLRLVLAELRQR
jgi:transposase